MDNNNLQQLNPNPDFELQVMTSIIEKNPIVQDMINSGYIAEAYDYVCNHYMNSNSQVPQECSTSNPSQRNLNQNSDNSSQAWINYAQILDPTVQSIPSLGNNSEPQRTNKSTSNHQPPNLISFQPLVLSQGASTSTSKNKGKAVDSFVVQGTDLEDHVQESWAFVSKLGENVESSKPHEERAVWPVPIKRRSRFMKPSMKLIINDIEIDTPNVPIPVCSCTGIPEKCYRYGQSGWRSSCCTSSISKYPLPKGPYQREQRIPGRKMNGNTFKVVLEQMLSQGHNLFVPIDLKDHWAKKGENKYREVKMYGHQVAP